MDRTKGLFTQSEFGTCGCNMCQNYKISYLWGSAAVYHSPMPQMHVVCMILYLAVHIIGFGLTVSLFHSAT